MARGSERSLKYRPTMLDHIIDSRSSGSGKNTTNGSRNIPRNLILDGEGATNNKNVTTTIEEGQFSRCETLETVEILPGSNVTSIGHRAFFGCPSLRSVTIASSSGDGAGITFIGRFAFCNCTSLQSITIPDTVTHIGSYAFSKCRSLESIFISGGVRIIEMWAFHGCTNLVSIHIQRGVMVIEDFSFSRCFSLKSIYIPDTVTYLGYRAFSGCTSLQSFRLPNSVTTIWRSAFQDCKSLTSISIPAGIIKIWADAFSGCKSLQSVLIPKGATVDHTTFENCSTLDQRLPDGRNYHPDTNTWLRQRFDGLPIHRACYYIADTQSAVSELSAIVQESKQTLAAADAMGMTALHILCCNQLATAEMVQVLVREEPSLLAHTDVTQSTPLRLFLKCRNILGGDGPQSSTPLSLEDALEAGVKYEDLAILHVLNGNREIGLASRRDENSGLVPFMTAATLSSCDFDVVYMLAMNNLDVVIS